MNAERRLKSEERRVKSVELKWKMGNGKWKMGRLEKPQWNFVSAVFSVLFFFLLLFGNANAQSVDSLINEALQNNPQLKAQKYKISASEFRAESVNNYPAPSLSLEFSQTPVSEINIFNESISNNLSLSQMFPLGGKISAMTEVEKRNINVEKNTYEVYKTNLTAQVRMTYFTLWTIERKIEVQNKNIFLLNDLIKSIEISYTVNRINQADLLTIQSEIAANETQLLILNNQKEAEIYKLNKLLGRDLNSKNVYTLQDTPADTIKYSQTELVELLQETNPSLNRMSSMIEMNRSMITANNKELIPDLMLQGMIMRMPRGMILTSKADLTMLDAKTDYMYSLMASITLPFAPWSINKIKAKEEELYAGISSIEYEKNDMARDMIAKFNEAYLKYNTANNLTRLYTNNVLPLYGKAAEAQVSAYQNGRTNINTVIDSYRMLLMQQMNYYMAKADIQMAVAEMEMMVGKRLSSSN